LATADAVAGVASVFRTTITGVGRTGSVGTRRVDRRRHPGCDDPLIHDVLLGFGDRGVGVHDHVVPLRHEAELP
jgi:hypothetical protein